MRHVLPVSSVRLIILVFVMVVFALDTECRGTLTPDSSTSDSSHEAPPAALPEKEGKTGGVRPSASKRLVALFEFDDFEPYEVPRFWDLYRGEGGAAGGGFPAWNGATLDYETTYRGQGAVRLSVSGGSVRLRLDPGVIPIFPDTEYLVSARVRTEGLEHARAAVTARYLDKQTMPIAGSERQSELITSRGDHWQLVTLALPEGFHEAAYIQIDLDVLQPEQFQPPRLGVHQVWPQDFEGVAWFDDVAVVQVPRVRIATSSGVNIIQHPEVPEISVQIRDLAGQALVGRLFVQDMSGSVVDAAEHRVGGGGSESWVWRPALERLGWYRAVLELSADSQPIGATFVDFAWVPQRASLRAAGRDASAFGVVVEQMPLAHMGLLAPLVHHTGAGAVTIPVWHSSLTREEIPDFAQELAQSIASLQMDSMQICFSLPVLPAELASAAHLDGEATLPVFRADESVWTPYLVPLLDRFGQTVQRWKTGSTAMQVFGEGGVEQLRDVLARLVPGPIVSLPWPGEVVAGRALDDADELTITVPYTLPAEAVPEFVRMWLDVTDVPLTFLLEETPHGKVSRGSAAKELAKKMVMLWSMRERDARSAAARISMASLQPWRWPEKLHPHPQPEVGLPVWRAVSERLAGRRIVGSLPVGPGDGGVKCLIAAAEIGGGPGALIAWRNGPVESPVLEAYLGEGPITVVDIFGNRSPVAMEAGAGGVGVGGGGRHRIEISDSPLFIEGVDVGLARFLASFEVEHGLMQPGTGEHLATVTLKNPWRTHVQGRLTILAPGGAGDGGAMIDDASAMRDRSWRITPRVMEFAIAPGQVTRLPLRIGFSAVEEHGRRDLVAAIELSGTSYPAMRVSSPLEIRVEDLELDLLYRMAGRGRDVDLVLEVIVTNRSGSPATLDVTAFAANYPRARASISELAPGATALRRFAFPEGGTALHGETIFVSVQNPETGVRINRSVLIE